MVDLAKKYGEDAAVQAYRACADAIPALQQLARGLNDVGIGRNHSLYIASRRRDRRALREEYELRAKHGFDVEWLEPGETQARYGISPPAAILSRLAGSIDPYRMTYRLLGRL